MYYIIRERATRAVKWSALGQWTMRAIQFLLLLLMARTLHPSEYGIFEITFLLLTLAQILQDFGLSRALIQTEADEDRAANIMFWVNILFSLAAFGLISTFAPSIASFFGEASATPFIRVAALQLIILSFRSVQLALAQRQLEYQRQFRAELLGSVATAIIAVGFLLAGFRLWAFIYGLVIGAIIQTSAYWLISPWRPSFKFKTDISRSLLGFGGLAAAEAFQGWLINYGDNLIVGFFLGVENLGLYALAFNIAVFSFSAVLQPVSSVAYASFSSLKSDTAELRRAFLNLLRYLALLILPTGVGLALVADLIADIVLAGRWPGITPLIQLIVLFPGISHLLILNPELYRAVGRPDIMPKLLLVTLLYSLPAYIVGAQFGLLGVILARISVTLIFFPVHVVLVSRFLKLKLNQLWDCVKIPLFATLIMAIIIFGLLSGMGRSEGLLGWVQLAFLVLFGGGLYGFFLWLMDRDLLKKVFRLTKQAV